MAKTSPVFIGGVFFGPQATLPGIFFVSFRCWLWGWTPLSNSVPSRSDTLYGKLKTDMAAHWNECKLKATNWKDARAEARALIPSGPFAAKGEFRGCDGLTFNDYQSAVEWSRAHNQKWGGVDLVAYGTGGTPGFALMGWCPS